MGCGGIGGVRGWSRRGARRGGATQAADEDGGSDGSQGDGRDAGAMRDQHMPGMMRDWSRNLDGGGGSGSGGAGSQAVSKTGGSSGGSGGQAAGGSAGVPSSVPSGGGDASNALIDAINEARQQAGLSPLTPDASLSADSAKNDQANVATGALDHHFDFGTAEVTAMASGGETPQQAVQQWLKSPGHRAIILDPNATRIGADITGQYATADVM